MRAVPLSIAVAATALLCACEPASEPAEADPATENMMVADAAAEAQAIRDVNAQWLEAVTAKDAAATAGFYAPDGRLMAPNGPTAQGTAAISEAFGGMLQMPNVDLSWTQDQVEVAPGGTMAYDIGTYRFAYDGETGRVEDNGKYLVVWKKVDGQWKVAADIFNSNLPAQ